MPRARNRQLLESSRRRQEERRRLVWLWRAAALVALIVLVLAFLNQPSGQLREVMITGARLVPLAEVRWAAELCSLARTLPRHGARVQRSEKSSLPNPKCRRFARFAAARSRTFRP